MSFKTSSPKAYDNIHKWLRYHFQKPDNCEKCRIAGKIEWANISGKYYRDRSDFMALCVPCHKLMDRKNFCKRGHEYTEDNLYYINIENKPTLRLCKLCAKARTSKYEKTPRGREKHRVKLRKYYAEAKLHKSFEVAL